MHQIENIPGRTILMAGKEFLYFSGTSYLGMAKNNDFSQLIEEGIRQYGNNYSSSRISNLQLKVFEEAENYLAAFVGSEAALTMSSGYMAGQLVVKLLENKKDTEFIYAPGAHPALWRTPSDFYIEDFDQWTLRLSEQLQVENSGHTTILCNAIDPLYAVKYSFDWIKTLPQNRKYIVVIDDSHGLGITGKNGSGIFDGLAIPAHVDLIVVSSLGKAMGVPGGAIFSSKKLIAELTKSAFFGGSSPAIPAYLFAFLKAGEIYKQARVRLFENIAYFAHQIKELTGFRYIPEYPVFFTDRDDWQQKLLQNDILVSSFPYPSSDDDRVTRVIINSLHTQTDMDEVIAVLKK